MANPREMALKLCQDIAMTTFGEEFNDGSTLPLNIVKKIATIIINETQIALRDQYNRIYNPDYQEEIGYWCNSEEALFWHNVIIEISNL